MHNNLKRKLSQSTFLAPIIMLAALITGYVSLSQGLPGDFLLDDHARIIDAQVKQPTIKEIMSAVLETDSGEFGRIIPLMTLYGSKAISGDDPELFRLQNIALHLITGLAIFWFLGRFLSLERFRIHITSNAAWILAASASALWLVHPIQVSTALYIIQRMTQLSTLFTFLALICYIGTRQCIKTDVRLAILPCLAFTAFLLAALLSKESAALIPLYILLIEYFGFGFQTRSNRERIFLFAGITAFSILPLMAGLIYFLTHIDTLLHDYVMRSFTIDERIASEAIIVWRYMGMLLIPRLSSMTLYHDGIAIHELSSLLSIAALLGWIFLFAIAIWFRNFTPIISFGILFFIASHLLESTILPLELMFEHRNYIGSAGIMLALTGFLYWIISFKSRMKMICGITYILIACLFTSMQVARASAWSDPYAFALISARENPASPRAVSMLANYQAQRGHIDEAQGLITEAIKKQKHDTALPGLHLHLIIFHCYEDDMSESLLVVSRKAMENAELDTYAINGLKALRNRLNSDDCPSLDREQLIPIGVAAADNPLTRREYRFFVNILVAHLFREINDPESAKSYLFKAQDYSKHVSLVSRRNHAIALTKVCIDLNDKKCAKTHLEIAEALDDKAAAIIGRDKNIAVLELLYHQAFPEEFRTNSN